jgi:hypothetical protein
MLTIDTHDTHRGMELDANSKLVLQATQRQVINAVNIFNILCQTIPSIATLHLIILFQEELDILHSPIYMTFYLK